MLKIGLIGIGACGNTITSKAIDSGWPLFLVNTAAEDIMGTGVKTIPNFTFGTAGGCGKNRAEAIKLVKENWQDFCLAIPKSVLECDVVFVIESVTGGTGSGMGVIVTDMLSRKYTRTSFGLIPVHETNSNSLLHLANSVMFHAELANISDKVHYMLYDNGKINAPVKEVHKRINDCILDDISLLSGIHLCPSATNIDKRDLTKLVCTPGMRLVIKIDNIDHRTLQEQSVSDLVLKGIKESYHLDVDFDKKGMQYLGMIYDLPKSALDILKPDYTALTDALGMPITPFEHMQESAEDTGCIVAIIAGLPIPDSRMADISKRVEAEESKMAVRAGDRSKEFKGKVSWLTDTDSGKSSSDKTEGEKDLDNLDFMGNY